MRKVVLLWMMFCAVVMLFAAAPQSEISFKNTVHDFGKFSEAKPKVTCTFEFTNTGNAPLIIHQAIASCGCTVPSFSEKPVAPGAKGEITVTYNGEGRFPGVFKKIITVRSNAKTSMVRLYITGEMTEK